MSENLGFGDAPKDSPEKVESNLISKEQLMEAGFYQLTSPPPDLQISQMNLDQLKEKLYELDEFEPIVKKYYAQLKEVEDRFSQLTGPGFEFEGDEYFGKGHHWQDHRGLVWVTTKCKGKFVSFSPLSIERTRDLNRGEKQGLSMVKARRFGYTVEGK